MASIPKHLDELEQLIWQAYEKANEGSFRLSRIGASFIGTECDRAVWLDWRGATYKKFPGRILRLFKTGHSQEERVLQDLKDAGLEVWAFDEKGDQWTYTFGHFVAKLDGVVRGVPGAEKTAHTLEIKSSNLKGFKEIQNRGVQIAKPLHYAQMQIGMELAGLTRSLYVCICKDDEKLYVERVIRDDTAIADLLAKINRIVESENPPIPIAETESDWRCKFCDQKAVCWKQERPLATCRMCRNGVAAENGEWVCGLSSKVLSQSEQIAACEEWEGIL